MKACCLYIVTLLVGLLPLSTIAQQKDQKSAQDYRCLPQRECQFEQWFVNLSLGQVKGDLSQQDVIDDAAVLGFDVFDVDIDDDRTAYKIGLGLHIWNAWEVEAGYLDLGDVETAFTTVTTQPDDFFSQTSSIHPSSANGPYLSAKFKIIDDVDWQLAVKAGVFFWDGEFDSYDVFGNAQVANSSDGDGTDLFYGIGLAYSLSDQINLTAEIERYSFSEEDADMLSVGLRYYF